MHNIILPLTIACAPKIVPVQSARPTPTEVADIQAQLTNVVSCVSAYGAPVSIESPPLRPNDGEHGKRFSFTDSGTQYYWGAKLDGGIDLAIVMNESTGANYRILDDNGDGLPDYGTSALMFPPLLPCITDADGVFKPRSSGTSTPVDCDRYRETYWDAIQKAAQECNRRDADTETI